MKIITRAPEGTTAVAERMNKKQGNNKRQLKGTTNRHERETETITKENRKIAGRKKNALKKYRIGERRLPPGHPIKRGLRKRYFLSTAYHSAVC